MEKQNKNHGGKRERVSRWMAGIGIFAFTVLTGISGQSLQQKDLMFPQVATGPTIETTICVTNRGDGNYQGRLIFWKGQNQDWNPIVNGSLVSGSELSLVVAPGETRVLSIQGTSSLVVGASAIKADDLSQDNFIEGNLVYTIEGQEKDSIGISPATELYRSVVPFEEFHSVGLALANPAPWDSAVVRLHLIDRDGDVRETAVRLLAERSHEARFLHEYFSSEVSVGKVEIEADGPILATAVTLANEEMSALPVLPSPVAYTFTTENYGEVDHAEVVLWTEGVFVKGYLRFLEVAGESIAQPENFLVSGSLVNGVLRLTQFGAGPEIGGQETVNFLKIQGFSFGGHSWTGHFTRIMNGFPFQRIIDGNFDLVRK